MKGAPATFIGCMMVTSCGASSSPITCGPGTVLIHDQCLVQKADADTGPPVMADGAATIGNADPHGDAGESGSRESCSGCLRFSVPLTGPNQYAEIFVVLPTLVDMSASTINYRVRVVAGKAGGLLAFPLNGAGNGYAGDYQYTSLSALSPESGTWVNLPLDVGSYMADVDAGRKFDKTRVASIRLQIAAGAGAGPWANPTIVDIDEISVSDDSAGPYSFDSGVMGFMINPSPGTPPVPPPEGTTLTWLGP